MKHRLHAHDESDLALVIRQIASCTGAEEDEVASLLAPPHAALGRRRLVWP